MFGRLFRRRPNAVILDADARIHRDGVLTENFGIRLHDWTIAPFAEIGYSYPYVNSFTFSTNEDHQDQITLFFYRGTDKLATNCRFLGQCRLRGFKLGPAGEPRVRLYFNLDDDTITLWAEDENKRNDISISVVANSDGAPLH